jgi:hypothetical protein
MKTSIFFLWLLVGSLYYFSTNVSWESVNKALGLPTESPKDTTLMSEIDGVLPPMVVVSASPEQVTTISPQSELALNQPANRPEKPNMATNQGTKKLREKYKNAPKAPSDIEKAFKQNINRQDSLRDVLIAKYDPEVEKRKRELNRLIKKHKANAGADTSF